MGEDEDLKQAVAGLRQQVKALASVAGVLLAALRRGGMMQPELEALLSSGLVEAAAAQSGQVRGIGNWWFRPCGRSRPRRNTTDPPTQPIAIEQADAHQTLRLM